MRTLQTGAKGQDVLDLQCSLAAAGYPITDLDGSFGPQTRGAVCAYQGAQGWPTSGVVDGQMAAALGVKDRALPAMLVSGISLDGLAKLFSEARAEDLRSNLPFVLNGLVEAGLTTPPLLAMTLATIRTEASRFLPLSEQQSALNTSAGGKPFDLYDRRPGLGNQGAPDGANFRGRGFIQLTGRANYQRFGSELGVGGALVANPLLAHDPAVAAKLLARFLMSRRVTLEAAFQARDMLAARRCINGGTNGSQPFAAAFQACMDLLPQKLEIVTMPRAA